MKKLRNWISEQRKLTAFLWEHKDEYYPRAKRLAIVYALSVGVMGFLFLVGWQISLTYGSVFLAFWSGVCFGVMFMSIGSVVRFIIRTAREIQSELKQKYNYNHVPTPPP